MRFLALGLLFASGLARAETDQDILLAPAEITTEVPAAESSVPQRISLGVGSGLNIFSGNIGQIYSTSSAVLDVRGEWALNPWLVGRIGADLANYSINAVPNGAVDVKTQSLHAAAQVHPLQTALASSGFDPYATVGTGGVFRRQIFRDLYRIDRDNAVAVNAGLGGNYFVGKGRLGVWAEGLVGKVYFADRYQAQYRESGAADTDGALYSARLGVKYYF